MGRGANFIIPAQQALNIRIIAPLKVRIANTVKFEKKTPPKAKEEIKRIHHSRKEFIRRYFCKDVSNANYYDIDINTQFITLNQAVKLIITAYKKKFSNYV